MFKFFLINILSILIFSKKSVDISSIFQKMPICRQSISIFHHKNMKKLNFLLKKINFSLKMSILISISIFSEIPIWYRYFQECPHWYRYRYFQKCPYQYRYFQERPYRYRYRYFQEWSYRYQYRYFQKCRYIDNRYGLSNTPSQVSNLSRKPVAYFHENLKTP